MLVGAEESQPRQKQLWLRLHGTDAMALLATFGLSIESYNFWFSSIMVRGLEEAELQGPHQVVRFE